MDDGEDVAEYPIEKWAENARRDALALGVCKSEADRIIYLVDQRRRRGDWKNQPERLLTQIEEAARRILTVVDGTNQADHPDQRQE